MNKPQDKRPVHSNPTQRSRVARAPYNFVPLPERIVTLKLEDLPGHDGYAAETYTGWFDCTLQTCSPTYVRGMMTIEQFNRYDPDGERHLSDEKQLALKDERAPFYATDAERKTPQIPGSTLRGLIRSLVEIISYGKVRRVNDAPKITFRAVAASKQDPLSDPYRELIGAFSRNVLAGYLQKTDYGWEIQPAVEPSRKGWKERGAFLKVKENKIPNGAIEGFRRFNDSKYWPDYFYVSFSATNKSGKRGQYVTVERIADDPDEDQNPTYPHRGVLVCTGSMLEIAKSGLTSPRRNHALILEPDWNVDALPIQAEVLEDYLDSLTPFQCDELWVKGGLKDNAPVFYVMEGGRVVWFGHTPNFRVPALNKATGRAAKPPDFIPEKIHRHQDPDFAEAIFGWIGEPDNIKDEHEKDDSKKRVSRAGRVFFSDAVFTKAEQGIWYSQAPITPSVLGSPKVTTFQHYLVQSKPDDRSQLAHYGSPLETTELRGHKLYWHKGDKPPIKNTADVNLSQLTRISPLNSGVHFRFRIHFENLRACELGALAWALKLPGEDAQTYRHKLGMGKPLGMGAVAITPELYLTNRSERYARLFEPGNLASAARPGDPDEFIRQFDQHILKQIASNQQKLSDEPRIRILLAMLQWRAGTAEWLDRTRYLMIEHPQFGNEYKERPVLPDPLAVSESVNRAVAENKPAAPINQPGTSEKVGAVVHIPPNRSFGYIRPDRETDSQDGCAPAEVFFHFNQLVGVKAVRKGQRVRFKVRDGKKGPEAHDISLIE